jgi:outer membrane protein assembly factor BamB
MEKHKRYSMLRSVLTTEEVSEMHGLSEDGGGIFLCVARTMPDTEAVKRDTSIDLLPERDLSHFSFDFNPASAERIYEEKNGLLVVEAEHFAKQSYDDVRKWYVMTKDQSPDVQPDHDENHFEGAAGGAYIEVLPDTRKNHSEVLKHGINFTEDPGRIAVLYYPVWINEPGRYYVWGRVCPTGTEDNGLHVGIDGTWPVSGYRMQWVSHDDDWHWDSKQRTPSVHTGENYRIFLDIEKPGLHTIMFSMREDGFELDRWLISKDKDVLKHGYRGVGPEESKVISNVQKKIGSDWTHFRGSELNALAPAHNYPVHWSDSLNVSWKTSIPGKGWSSPVVYDDQAWITTAKENGKEMSAICTDLHTGKIIHNIKLFQPDSIYRIHAVNSYATPTPCIEKGLVYLHFGRYGTAAVDTENGNILWKRTDLQCEHIQGPGSSPILHKEKLILHMEGTDVQYIVALDKKTGETLWRVERPEELYEHLPRIGKKAYITPIVVEVDGRELLISNGSAVCIAYDVETGKEVWRIVQGEDSTISMPFEENGVVYFYTSFVTPEEGERYCELLAVDPNGEGDIAESNILWRVKSPPLQLLTPVIYEGLIYTVDSRGNLFCLDAKSGKEYYRERMRGKFNSSPVFASGNIYFHSTQGETIVVREGKELNILARNRLDGEIWSTPAFVDGAIILRTSKYLYRIKE